MFIDASALTAMLGEEVDGAELMARVMVPHGFEPHGGHPMIVGSVYSDGLLNQWGGRAAHPSWGIDQYLVSRGFVVVNGSKMRSITDTGTPTPLSAIVISTSAPQARDAITISCSSREPTGIA